MSEWITQILSTKPIECVIFIESCSIWIRVFFGIMGFIGFIDTCRKYLIGSWLKIKLPTRRIDKILSEYLGSYKIRTIDHMSAGWVDEDTMEVYVRFNNGNDNINVYIHNPTEMLQWMITEQNYTLLKFITG